MMIPIACCQRIEHDVGDGGEAVRRSGVLTGRGKLVLVPSTDGGPHTIN